MTERKYQYKNPKNNKEYIEAIYEEINFTKRDRYYFNQDLTIKDLIKKILSELQDNTYRKKLEKEDENRFVEYSKYSLFMLGFVFISISQKDSNFSFLSNNYLAIKLWGIALISLFVGISMESISFFRNLWSFGLTKIISSIGVSGLFIFCTGKASGLINNVFHIDASALPYTRTFVSGFMFFLYLSPLLVIVMLIIIFVYVLYFVSWICEKYDADRKNYSIQFPTNSVLFTIASVVLLTVTINFFHENFNDYEWPAKIYKLGHALDFNDNYVCSNIPAGNSVLFLGDRQDRVLVDYGSAGTTDMDKIIGERGSFVVTNNYKILPCDDSKQITQ